MGRVTSSHEDEKYYEAVVKELESGSPRPGLWAKAFAESSGNGVAARALYIKLRAQQLTYEANSKALALERARTNAFLEKLGIKWKPLIILAILLGLGYVFFFY